ncbi:TPA: hypothetical protein SAQ42_003987 [Klebsiella oxytoca]|nr:hypothetical protein [Klebsiella oxytoca]EKU5186626.1 hypothetical protein [Klebsiella oxytoca]TGN43069.1 hypothetical protein E5Q62_19080 [Klebsiella oxytoca]HBM3243527.1 hypothetical protein [Klebsiella oxytoca]HEC2079965.1 hypothetical protein [Klebsiella oxytoca]
MEFTDRTGFKVYFCDPQSPGQRESNKNFNELIRLFFPKKTCLKKGSPLVVVAEGMIMVYLIARGHRHGRKVPLRSYSQSVHSVAGKVHFLDENVGSVTVTAGIAENTRLNVMVE